jgi:hypothetical protein
VTALFVMFVKVKLLGLLGAEKSIIGKKVKKR